MARIIFVLMFLATLCSVSFAVMPDDLVLYMSFDNNTIAGKEAKDLSKYGNNGVIVGAPNVAVGHKGDALDFNGASDGVEMVTSESFAKTATQITLEAWLYPRIDAQMSVITKWDGLLNGIFHFEVQAGGAMRFCMRSGNNNADTVMIDLKTAGGMIPKEKWTYVAETYDGKTARIYIDGVEAINGACAGVMRDNANMKYWIGTLYTTQGRWFGGLIDEVCIWSRALTPDEIKKSMDGTLVGAAVVKENKLATAWGYLKK